MSHEGLQPTGVLARQESLYLAWGQDGLSKMECKFVVEKVENNRLKQ